MNEIDKEKERERRLLARKRLRRLRARARLRRTEEEKALSDHQGAVPIPPLSSEDAMLDAPTAAAAKERQAQRRRELDALERDVLALSRRTDPDDIGAADIEAIRRDMAELKRDFYAHLSAWQRLLLARHPQRPYTEDFVRLLFENFSEIHGDRHFADDPALIAGMAWFHGQPVMVLGSQKGRDTKQRVARNFGQAKPEGYRKALRAMQLAAKFNRPVFVFVDTPGAFPGIDAEERGQAEAIALNLREMSRLPVPVIVTITGEGGSGGALGIAVGDRVFMLENSVYSVISPEGCASIVWRDSTKAETAAEALKITAPDLLNLKLIDEIVPEPDGGAHTDHVATAKLLDPVLSRSLAELATLAAPQLVDQRYEKFRRMGHFFA